jgi:hypothetical protein
MNWRDKLRSSPWLLLAIPPLIVVVVIAPWQLGVLAWTLAKQAIAVTLDRSSRDRLDTQLRQHDGVPVSGNTSLPRKAAANLP